MTDLVTPPPATAVTLQFADNALLSLLLGDHDRHLVRIEQGLGVRLSCRGNRVAIAWKEFDGERSRLRALRSDDAGSTWRELDLAATAGASGHPIVLVRQGAFHVFWNTQNEPLSVVALP